MHWNLKVHLLMPVRKKTSPELQLIKEVKALSAEVKKLKKLEFIKVFKHPVKFIFFSFLKGLAVGFGSVLGASLVVGIFVYLLAQISLVPIVGDFVQDIMSQINVTQNGDGNGSFLEQYEQTKSDIQEEKSNNQQ